MKIKLEIDTNKLKLDEYLPVYEQHIYMVIKDINHIKKILLEEHTEEELQIIEKYTPKYEKKDQR